MGWKYKLQHGRKSSCGMEVEEIVEEKSDISVCMGWEYRQLKTRGLGETIVKWDMTEG